MATMYQCSICYKCYLKWRWAAKHLAKIHDGYGCIENYDPLSLTVEATQR